LRILHISDLHIGREIDIDRWKKAEQLVEEITREWGSGEEKPLVLITGDVVDDGTEIEYIEARRVLKPLRQAGFLVVPLPGNHDYGWNGAFARESRFELFRKYLLQIETPVSYPSVPYADPEVTILTLNSMLAETGRWDRLFADGELGREQLQGLDRLVTKLHGKREQGHRVVVALHHHPFLFPDDSPVKKAKEQLTHRLKDGDDLMEIVSGRIDALLFGHEHRHVDFSKPLAGHLLTEEYEIPCILASGRSTDAGLPARVITIKRGHEPRVNPAPWLSRPRPSTAPERHRR